MPDTEEGQTVTNNYNSQYSNLFVKFTLNDIPHSQWRSRLQEMLAWSTAQLTKPDLMYNMVIKGVLPGSRTL